MAHPIAFIDNSKSKEAEGDYSFLHSAHMLNLLFHHSCQRRFLMITGRQCFKKHLPQADEEYGSFVGTFFFD